MNSISSVEIKLISKKIGSLQVEICALFQRIERATEAVVRSPNVEYLCAIFHFSFPPTLMEKVCAIRHDLIHGI